MKCVYIDKCMYMCSVNELLGWRKSSFMINEIDHFILILSVIEVLK